MDDAYARDVSEVRPVLPWSSPSPDTRLRARAPDSPTARAVLAPMPASRSCRTQVLAHYQVDLDHGMTLDQVEKVRSFTHGDAHWPQGTRQGSVARNQRDSW